MIRRHLACFWGLAGLAFAAPALADEDASKLAEKLNNPVSSLISVPFQFNYDCCFGPRDGGRVQLNIQPVIPFAISNDWNVIVRTITPVIDQEETVPGAGSHFGIGDITQTFFFSPNPDPGGIIWAAGPVFLWPTATDPDIGSRKWGAGPSIIVLQQKSGWTYGILANHIWSYSREHERANVNSTFLQPFLNYTWPDSTGIGLNSESTYDWTRQQWSVPLNLSLSHIYKLDTQPISVAGGVRWYPATFADGPRWGLRFNVTLLLPG
jgi:hypothetical protein